MAKYWEDEEFIIAVKNSASISEVLRYFEVPHNQGYYHKIFHFEIKRLNLDIKHMNLKLKSNRFKQRLIHEQIFCENSKVDRATVKKRIIKEGLLPYKCFKCGINNWCEEQLSLHLDHINGISNDHRIDNLRFLCPNCHSQTPTYSGKNVKQSHIKHICGMCKGTKKTTHSVLCNKCARKQAHNTKIEWPSITEIIELVNEHGFSKAGRMLGVSDNAIRKHLKCNGNSSKVPGFPLAPI